MASMMASISSAVMGPPGAPQPAYPGKQYLIGGNWKCNGTKESVAALVATLNGAGPIPAWVEVVCGVPAVHIGTVLATLRQDISVAAQDCSETGFGAYTGELAAEMLADFGVKWVILGHSERRTNQKESSALVAKKTKMALDAGLSVMVCVGETLAEREAGKIDEVVLGDHLGALKGKFTDAEWARVAIAYEPVWAIGTGKTATPEQAQEVHASIRKWLLDNVGEKVSKDTRIQYGGSMKGANAAGLLAKPDIDGGLIGGASLKAEFITGIAQNAPEPK
jgi:triosephosphate isomerase